MFSYCVMFVIKWVSARSKLQRHRPRRCDVVTHPYPALLLPVGHRQASKQGITSDMVIWVRNSLVITSAEWKITKLVIEHADEFTTWDNVRSGGVGTGEQASASLTLSLRYGKQSLAEGNAANK